MRITVSYYDLLLLQELQYQQMTHQHSLCKTIIYSYMHVAHIIHIRSFCLNMSQACIRDSTRCSIAILIGPIIIMGNDENSIPDFCFSEKES